MKIKSIRISDFRRFHSLSIPDLPPAKLVMMAGPNGAGKSSLFDAFSIWHQSQMFGIDWDAKYHSRDTENPHWNERVKIELDEPVAKTSFYLRSAYRNDPGAELKQLQKLADPSEQPRVKRMMEQDNAVSQNYQRLAADAFEDAFDSGDETQTLKQFRQAAIGDIQAAVLRLFPDLDLNTLGNPLSGGTFRFSKGTSKGFSYRNLSGGEKAAFDLLLDMVLKTRTFTNTVFAIDEPESHMNTRLQGALLDELYKLIPDGSQLWIATHSIGMMRKARELHEANVGTVVFLDFEGHDYDQEVTLRPVAPTRAFWERILRVALDDLAELVAPKQLVICEGNPTVPIPAKNESHDARCYEIIFGISHPDTKFISSGSSKDVSGDRLRFAHVFPLIVPGIDVRRVIDRDDHAPHDVAEFKQVGINTLSRRHLEAYLYDEEVLRLLCDSLGRSDAFPAIQVVRSKAISESVTRLNPQDDIKSAASAIYVETKKILGLTSCGNDQMAFARNILAPLVKPGLAVYEELRADIFD